ncbi:MAG: tol-pal system protein YbgF [Gammaproteobacteria bacterium]|nr:MAG: tol-pal system protein YbgF [Gammaproteobacteria bacterium]
MIRGIEHRHLRVNGASALAGSLVLALMAPLTLSAQERVNVRTLNERLIRVENVLDQSMLQQMQQIDALQLEIRQLRGELERVGNEAETARERSELIIRDLEDRLTELEQRNPASLLDENGNLRTDIMDETDGDGAGQGRDAAGDDQSSSQNGGSGDDAGGGVKIVAGAEAGQADGAGGFVLRKSATREEADAYNAAYQTLARGQTKPAIDAFHTFIEQYPAGPYTGNAWYWEGEALYAEQDFDAAIDRFETVLERFPSSVKVPDAELKIGFSLYEQQRYDQARKVLERVRDVHTGRPPSVLARKRLQEMDRDGL